jgi:hypothetical protein
MNEYEIPLTERQPSIIVGELLSELKLSHLKDIRNTYLNYTDKFILPDFPITPANLEIIQAYRQMLRESINNNKDLILSGGTVEIPPNT